MAAYYQNSNVAPPTAAALYGQAAGVGAGPYYPTAGQSSQSSQPPAYQPYPYPPQGVSTGGYQYSRGGASEPQLIVEFPVNYVLSNGTQSTALVKLFQYSPVSIAVTSSDPQFTDGFWSAMINEAGGKQNKGLKVGSGYIFQAKKENDILNTLIRINSGPIPALQERFPNFRPISYDRIIGQLKADKYASRGGTYGRAVSPGQPTYQPPAQHQYQMAAGYALPPSQPAPGTTGLATGFPDAATYGSFAPVASASYSPRPTVGAPSPGLVPIPQEVFPADLANVLNQVINQVDQLMISSNGEPITISSEGKYFLAGLEDKVNQVLTQRSQYTPQEPDLAMTINLNGTPLKLVRISGV